MMKRGVDLKNIKEFLDRLIESSTPEKPAWNIEHILENEKPKWNYIDGCMIKAILEMYYISEDEKYINFADSFIDFYVNEKGEILGYIREDYNCDNINEGKVLFDLYSITKKDKYRKAIDVLYAQIKSHPRTNKGNLWHKKIYPHQVWLDGLYMVQPFYIEYENKFNENKNYKDVFNQFKNVYDLMIDRSTNLLFHGYDESLESFWADKTTGLSKNFWTRSLGWYTMALVDTIEKFNEQFFYEYHNLHLYLKEILDALLKFMDSREKMFWQVTNYPNKKGNYLETSGTCAIAYSLMKGARLGYLPVYYFNYGLEIFNAVVKSKLVIEDNKWILKDICLVAGLGGMPGKGDYKLRDGTYEYYISEPVVNNDAKGVAPFLLAFTEVYRNQLGGNK